ncbi:MAG: amino acid permease [Alphaproteobacteria bacterium]|nr:amino acid permease [Alphaproteobacteria bacterium]
MDTNADNRGRLGTFAGVFTPSILTILGIILFLRLGYIVGSGGLEQALIVIALANLISLVTSLSVAAISTNFPVKAGGDYYLISRSLGLGFGGAIGLVLFLAQAVSVGFYCIGFAEAAAAMSGQSDAFIVRIFGVSAASVLAVLAWLGADWATRFQFVVMAAIAAALAAFATGSLNNWDANLLLQNWSVPPGGIAISAAFAIFFPAVTGFTQGVSMSGDLAYPAKSIPRGVLASVLLSMVIYFGCAVLFAGALPSAVLISDQLSMKRIAAAPVLVDAGLAAATLSSALASFLGAPRILQSLASDRIFPLLQPFAVGTGPTENPRRAVALTGAVALAVILAGDLNAIAAIVSMFFLISYGLLNYATYYEATSGSPAFRPRFRLYHPTVGLIGAVVCFAAMLAIDVSAAIAAAAIVFGIYQYLEFRAVPARWADSRRSHNLQEARSHLLAAASQEEHPRDWRPQLLVFSDSPERRLRLLRLTSWIEGESSLATVVRILEGNSETLLEGREEALKELTDEIRSGGFAAFPLVVTGENLDQTISSVIQATGIGPLKANTVVANWIDGQASALAAPGVRQFSRNLRVAFRLGCNLLVLDASPEEWEALNQREPKLRVVDVYWRANRTGELMLLLAHILTHSSDWRGSKMRVLVHPEAGQDASQAEQELKKKLEEFRIEADVLAHKGEIEELTRISKDSSFVFLPFSIHGGRFYDMFGNEFLEIGKSFPVAGLTMAAQDVDLAADLDKEDKEEAGETTAGTADGNGEPTDADQDGAQ